MKIEIKKLDKRHTGQNCFKYIIKKSYNDIEDFNAIREWCWDQWGPSCELESYLKLNGTHKSTNGHWAWVSEYGNRRIYLVDDKDATIFALKWS